MKIEPRRILVIVLCLSPAFLWSIKYFKYPRVEFSESLPTIMDSEYTSSHPGEILIYIDDPDKKHVTMISRMNYRPGGRFHGDAVISDESITFDIDKKRFEYPVYRFVNSSLRGSRLRIAAQLAPEAFSISNHHRSVGHEVWLAPAHEDEKIHLDLLKSKLEHHPEESGNFVNIAFKFTARTESGGTLERDCLTKLSRQDLKPLSDPTIGWARLECIVDQT